MPFKFCAPSTSAASAATTPTRAKSKKPGVIPRRPRAHKLDKAKTAVKEAAKRVHKAKQLVEPCVAYVGNIGPDVDENTLITHFSHHGKVLSVRIHCCGGVAMTVKPPPAGYHQNMRVRQYAMVVFETKLARHMACKEEHTLKGRKLIVSIVVSDLPEVQEKIGKRLDDYRAREEPADVRRAQKSAVRSLKLEPTVVLAPMCERKGRRRKRVLMGHSLEEGVM